MSLWRVLKTAFLMLCLILPLAARAQYSYSDNGDGTCVITGYAGPAGSLSIPQTINGLTVASIGDQAFYQDLSITSVSIPEGVTSVDDYAFSLCGNLTQVSFPNSLTNIGAFAFGVCTNLSSVSIPTNVTSLSVQAFDFCYRLTNVYFPDTLTNIASRAFDSCDRLPGVIIPRSVISIASDAFSACTNLVAISVAPDNAYYSSTNGVLFDKQQKTLIEWPAGKSGDYTMPESVTGMEDYAFVQAYYLTNLTAGSHLTNIANDAFSACINLANVTLGDAVGVIGTNAFESCYGLTNITFGKGPISFEDGAFDACESLQTISLPVNLLSIGDYAFEACQSLNNIIIPGSTTNLGYGAFENCAQLTNAVIPAALTVIGDESFGFCNNLKYVYFKGNQPIIRDIFGYPPVYIFEYDASATVYYLPGTTGWTNTFAGFPVSVWNPQVQTGDGHFGVSSNSFGFNITGTTNLPVLVEAATQLTAPSWVSLFSGSVTNGEIYFSDPQWVNYSRRFYRIRSP
jgi:hypothetical protein